VPGSVTKAGTLDNTITNFSQKCFNYGLKYVYTSYIEYFNKFFNKKLKLSLIFQNNSLFNLRECQTPIVSFEIQGWSSANVLRAGNTAKKTKPR